MPADSQRGFPTRPAEFTTGRADGTIGSEKYHILHNMRYGHCINYTNSSLKVPGAGAFSAAQSKHTLLIAVAGQTSLGKNSQKQKQ